MGFGLDDIVSAAASPANYAAYQGYNFMQGNGSIGSLDGGSAWKYGAAMVPGLGDYMATSEANKANIAMSSAQMAFQERMSNTAYQRATEDMRKAGINPMLAYQQGGASTPSGATADIKPKIASALGRSAMDAMLLNKELDQKDSQTKLNEVQKEVAHEQKKLTASTAQKVAAEAEISEAEIPVAKAEARVNEKTANINEKMTWLDAMGSRAKSTLASLLGVATTAASMRRPRAGAKITPPRTKKSLPMKNGYVDDTKLDF